MNKLGKHHLSLILCLTTTAWFGLTWSRGADEHAALAATVLTEPSVADPVTDKELVRNGVFDQYDGYGQPTGWYVYGTGAAVDATAGQDGGPALSLDAIMETQAIARQEIHLPSQTSAAAFAFDYRLLPTYGGSAYLQAGIMKGDDPGTATVITTTLTTNWVSADTGWGQAQVSLDAATVTQIQSAHAAGQHVWLVFNLVQSPANAFKAHLDDVSFKVTGSQDTLDQTGSIAYIGMNDNGYARTVNRIAPDGKNQQTLWTHPATLATSYIYDLAWKPDAGELAFSSDHEWGYSAYHSDVYGIKPDGSGLRRISNPPSQAKVKSGAYPMGAVTGQIFNNYGSTSSFFLYVEGAQEPISVAVGNYNETTSFTINNVADLGAGHTHYVALNWSSTGCSGGIEYAVAIVDVVAGQTADAGTLQFNGHCNQYNASDVTWKGDGSQVGFSLSSMPWKVQSAGQTIGTALFDGINLGDDVAWSPTSDNVLYRVGVGDQTGIYQAVAGASSVTRLIADQIAVWAENPAWLADGSGFVYTYGDNVYHYNLSNSQTTQLTDFYNESAVHPSPSPDGDYVVFERMSKTTPARRDLWILNRNKPVEMWPLIEDGKSSTPDWSRATPQTNYKLYLPALLRNQ
jgi:hypothetical protein